MTTQYQKEAQAQKFDCRDAFAATLADLARTNTELVLVVNDSVGSSKLVPFRKEFPTRTINVGIAEQDLVGVSAGLANAGKVPFVSTAGCFLTARGMEQIKADLAYSKRHVVLCAQSPGMAYGQLGATHHSIEDVAWMRVLPNMTVLVPGEPAEVEQVMRWAATHDGPVYIRIPRMAIPAVLPTGSEFAPGKSITLREGHDITLMANGTVISRAAAAADLLEEAGISVRVLSMTSVKPIDEEAVIAASRETRAIVTAEEGLAAGGMGGAVAEVVLQKGRPVPMKIIGMPDRFAPTGSASWLMDTFGISAEGMARAATSLLA